MSLGSLENLGLIGVVRFLRDNRYSCRRAARFLTDRFAVEIHHSNVSRTWNRIDDALGRGEQLQPMATAREVDSLSKLRLRTVASRKADAIKKAKDAVAVVEACAVEAPMADRLGPMHGSERDDAIRMAGLIDWSAHVSRTGIYRTVIPRWLLAQLFSRARPDPSTGEEIETEPAALVHGLYVRESDCRGDPDDLVMVAQVYSPQQRLQAAQSCIRAIDVKYKGREESLPQVNVTVGVVQQAAQTDDKGPAPAQSALDDELDKLPVHVLAQIALGDLPDDEALSHIGRDRLQALVDQAAPKAADEVVDAELEEEVA